MLHLASTWGMHLFIICIMRSLRVPNIISWGPSTLVLCWAYFHLSLSVPVQVKLDDPSSGTGHHPDKADLLCSLNVRQIHMIHGLQQKKAILHSSSFIHFTPFLCRSPVLCVIKHFVWQCVFYSAGDCPVYLYDACNRQNKAFKNMCVSLESLHCTIHSTVRSLCARGTLNLFHQCNLR